MLLEFFNELKNNFMAVCQIRNVDSIAMLKFWSWTLYLLFLHGEKSSIIPSGVRYNLLNFFFCLFLCLCLSLSLSLSRIHISKQVNNLLLDLSEWQQLPLTAKGRESGSKLALPCMPKDLCWKKKLCCFDNLEKWDLDNNGSELQIQNQITEYKASVTKVLEEHLLLFSKPHSYKSRQVK